VTALDRNREFGSEAQDHRHAHAGLHRRPRVPGAIGAADVEKLLAEAK
jgi:hypothetical protein